MPDEGITHAFRKQILSAITYQSDLSEAEFRIDSELEAIIDVTQVIVRIIYIPQEEYQFLVRFPSAHGIDIPDQAVTALTNAKNQYPYWCSYCPGTNSLEETCTLPNKKGLLRAVDYWAQRIVEEQRVLAGRLNRVEKAIAEMKERLSDVEDSSFRVDDAEDMRARIDDITTRLEQQIAKQKKDASAIRNDVTKLRKEMDVLKMQVAVLSKRSFGLAFLAKVGHWAANNTEGLQLLGSTASDLVRKLLPP